MTIEALCWPLERLGEGIEALARFSGLASRSPAPSRTQDTAAPCTERDALRWIEWTATRLELEAEPVETTAAELDGLIRHGGPSIVRLRTGEGIGYLLMIRSGRTHAEVLAPDLQRRSCRATGIRDALCARLEAPVAAEVDHVLELSDLRGQERMRARAALLNERIGAKRIDGLWLLRLPPTTSFWRQLIQARLPHRVGAVLAVFAALYGFEIIGWGLVGNAVLSGRLDLGWMWAWLLLLVTLVPLALLGGWLNATFALGVGRILKRRLLAGALRLDIDSVRHQGIGQLLSRVMESQALEGLALNGGMSVLVAMLELVFAAWILSLGAGGFLLVSLLAGWIVVTIVVVLLYTRHMRAWTAMRLDMTHALLERMVGHRTVLAQEWPWRRDTREDQDMNAYLEASRRLDRVGVAVFAGVPGGWGLVGLFGLAPAFVSGTASPAQIAIAFGGLLLSTRAFSGIAMGVSSLAGAFIAWNQAGPLFRAGSADTAPAPFLPSQPTTDKSAPEPSSLVLDASRLVFRHAGQRDPVLDGTSLAIHRGERLLLEGPSGGGKSSLASILVGLRRPESGLLLLGGLDRATLGNDWHRLATEAPQFHENHVMTGTLAFNLLMGRGWPASDDEIEEARLLLVDLGLGPLIERMPAGMLQRVGETGWQLSHGERSRIFLARALLQKARFTVMDESFAALDPETLQTCLSCVFERADTLMVIAHP